jgi:hypothetical protein
MSWIDSDLPQKQCCECFYWYPADRHHWAAQYAGRYGLASRCKLCTVVNSRLLAELKRNHPKPEEGTPCERCYKQPTTLGTRGRGLSCDHCHETGAFRGWVCTSCQNRDRRPFVR